MDFPWHKAAPGQIFENGDELLVARRTVVETWFYDIVMVRCDVDRFELLPINDGLSYVDWCDVQYWCHTKDIPAPEPWERIR